MQSRQQRQKEKKRRQRALQKKRQRWGGQEVCVEELSPETKFIYYDIPDSMDGADLPGGCDESLARPDCVMFEYKDFVMRNSSICSALNRLQHQYEQGRLNVMEGVRDWAMDEYLWHGAPGDACHPIEAFLAVSGDQFSPMARDQLRRWKQAKLGIYEIGRVSDRTYEIRPWNVSRGRPAGPWVTSIALSVGGLEFCRQIPGSLMAAYVAPWAPEKNLFCTMRFMISAPKDRAADLALFPYLDDAELACSRWNWNSTPDIRRQTVQAWKARDWYTWLGERMEFPFKTFISTEEICDQATVYGVISSHESAVEYGIYFYIKLGRRRWLKRRRGGVIGAASIMPLDFTSTTAEALAEYRKYRDRVGPPPGARGASLSTLMGRCRATS